MVKWHRYGHESGGYFVVLEIMSEDRPQTICHLVGAYDRRCNLIGRKVAEGGFEQSKQGILVLKVDAKGKYCDKNPGE